MDSTTRNNLNNIIKQLEKSSTLSTKSLQWLQILDVCDDSIIAEECCKILEDDGWIRCRGVDQNTIPQYIVTTEKFLRNPHSRYY